MARNKRNISQPLNFEDYANKNVIINTDKDTDTDKKDSVEKKPVSQLERLKEKDKVQKKLASFHVEKELLNILNRESKKLGHGGKTKIVNLALKEFFEKEGLL